MIALAATAVAFGTAVPAHAAGDYAYVQFSNNGSPAVTIDRLTWSGSYNPQLPSNIDGNTTKHATIKSVFDYGYSSLSFYAKVSGTSKECYFTFDMANSDGSIAYVGKAALGTPAECYAYNSGNNIYFSIK